MAYTDEQCFADPKLTSQLMRTLKGALKDLNIVSPVIFEATCGDGRLVQELKVQVPHATVYANDLDPIMAEKTGKQHLGTMNEDFLTFDWKAYFTAKGHSAKDMVICTGFPYGYRSALAVNCFNTAAKFVDTMVIIIPASFNNPNTSKLLDLDFHLVSSSHVHNHAFEWPNGEKVAVGSVVQVWVRKETKRTLIKKKSSHPDFQFLTNTEAVSYTGNNLIAVRARGNRYKPVRTPTAKLGWFRGQDAKNRLAVSYMRDYLKIVDPSGKAMETILNVDWFPLLSTGIKVGNITKDAFVLAHENHHYGLHQDYFDMIS